MSKPFQFSMGRMFYAVGWFALSAWLGRAAYELARLKDIGNGLHALFFLFVAIGTVPAFGAGIGTLFGRPFDGAVWASAAAVGLMILIAFGSAFYVHFWR